MKGRDLMIPAKGHIKDIIKSNTWWIKEVYVLMWVYLTLHSYLHHAEFIRVNNNS